MPVHNHLLYQLGLLQLHADLEQLMVGLSLVSIPVDFSPAHSATYTTIHNVIADRHRVSVVEPRHMKTIKGEIQ